MSAENLFKQYLDAANFKRIDGYGDSPKLKEYTVTLVNGGGRTYNFGDHYVNFSESGNHLSTFCFRN